MEGVNSLDRAIAVHQSGRLDEAQILYRQALEADPNNPDVLHLLGVVAAQRGRFEEAVERIGRAIAIRSDVPGYHGNLGNALLQQGCLGEALQSFDRALALDRRYADAHFNKGNALRELGRDEAALDCYRAAVQSRANHVDALCNAGAVLSRLGRLEEAEASLRQALEIAPDHPQALHDLGDVLRVSGRWAEASDCFERALAVAPDLVQARVSLGRARYQQGSIEVAVDHFESALRQRPDHRRALLGLGRARLDLERYGEAADCFAKLVAADVSDVDAQLGLGYALLYLGRPQEAFERLEMVLARKPDHFSAAQMRAAALALLGRKPEAVAATQAAVKLQPLSEEPCSGQAAGTVLVLYSMENAHFAMRDGLWVRRTNASNALRQLDTDRLAVCRAYVGEDFIEEVVPRLPPFDVVYNQITEPDNCPRSLAVAQTFVDSLSVPVLNQPGQVAHMTRDANYRRFRDIPGLIYPRTVRIDFGADPAGAFRAVMEDGEFDWPVIVRRAGTHTGVSAVMIESVAAFDDEAAAFRDTTAYVIQFVDSSPDGRHYNRMRIFSADGRIIARNIRFSDQWNTHEGVGDDVVIANPWMQEEDARFIADPARYLGEPAYTAIESIVRSVNLDFFGLDFTRLNSGEVLMFEVNPTMSFSGRKADTLPYRRQSYLEVKTALNDMILRRISSSKSG